MLPAIRPLTPQDIAPVVTWMVQTPLWQRYALSATAARAQFERALRGGDLLLAADLPAKTAVGFAWCMPGGAFGRSAYLRLIGVHPDHAGQGIGSALLDAVEAQVTSSDLFLLVSDFNLDAQRFYRRQGYAQIGVIPGYVLPDVDEHLFRKRLDRVVR